MFQLGMMILVSDYLFRGRLMHRHGEGPTWDRFIFWLKIEEIVFLSYLVANMIWLFIRSLKHNAIEIIPNDKFVTNKSDYLEANLTILGVFEAFFSPFFVGCFIFLLNNRETNDYIPLDQRNYAKIFLIIQSLQIVFYIFINFIAFSVDENDANGSCTRRFPLRNKFLPYVHTLFFISIFFLLPTAAIILYGTSLYKFGIAGEQISDWFLMYAIDSAFIFVWGCIVALPKFKSLRKEHLEFEKEKRYAHKPQPKSVRIPQESRFSPSSAPAVIPQKANITINTL